VQTARRTISTLQPLERHQIFEKNVEAWLLPLQVGAHYAFRHDSGMGSSAEFLSSVLDEAPDSVAIAVTQYRSSFTSDAPINEKNITHLESRWPQLTWSPDFEKIPSPSHFILPLVDKLVTHSSSVLFQAMVWDKPVQILQGSHFERFSAQNDDDLSRNRGVLACLLGRYNVLNDSITKDKRFLPRMLETAVALKRRNHIDIDHLPSFHDIDPDYGGKLLGAFDGSAIIKALGRINPSIPEREKIGIKFISACKKKEIKIISFDVFDTLIARPVETPVALFHMMQTAAERALEMRFPDFSRIRALSEKHAREQGGAEEIQIEDIYIHVAEHYQLSAEETARLIACEIDVEVRMALPRSMGMHLWSLAMASGKKIILISDMYLPKTAIERMLNKCGYSGYGEIFISSDCFNTKRTGGLYDHVLAASRVNGHNVFHTGDNKNADCVNAEKRGFRTMYVPKAIDRMRKNKIYTQIFPPKYGSERARAIVSGLIAQRLFEGIPVPGESTTLFAGEPWRLGYAALGPLYTGFSQWLHREAKRENIAKLYFLAREGYLLRDIYNIVHGGNALPNAFLLCSRRAARVAALQTPRQVAELAGEAFDRSANFGTLLKHRFGLDIQTLAPEKKAELEFDIDETLETSPEGRSRFSRACTLLAPEILDHAAGERSAYLRYLDNMGFQSEKRPAVVDLGWKGNMQTALGRLRGKEIFGYYLATLSGVEGNSALHGYMRAYAGERLNPGFADVILENRKILELLTCHASLSFSRFSFESTGNLRPEFLEDANHIHNARVIREVHRGARLFAEDYHRSFGDEDPETLIDYTLVSRVLRSFLTTPTTEDAILVSSLSFEDGFAGAAAITMKDAGSNVWPTGAAVLTRQVSTESAGQARISRPASRIAAASSSAGNPAPPFAYEAATKNEESGAAEKKQPRG